MFAAFLGVPAAAAAAVAVGGCCCCCCALPEEDRSSISSKNRATRFPVSGGWDAPWILFVVDGRSFGKVGGM